MKNKKSEKVNLEKKRGLFLQIGLIIAFLTMLYAFEWATPDLSYKKISDVVGVNIETEIVPVTRVKEIKPPPPKYYKKITIVPDTEEPKETFVPPIFEVDPDDIIETTCDGMNMPIEIEEPEIVYFAKIMPEFPGGIVGLKLFISKKIKYPIKAIEGDIQGKVYVRFVVNSKGETEQVSIIRGIDPILDKEALRVVKSFPKWKPGEQNGKAVNVWYTVPIVFRLEH